ENVAVGIMGGDAGKWPVGRALEPLHARVVFAHALEHRFCVLDFDAEMIKAGNSSGAAGIDVETDIAVADRHCAAWPRLGRGLHAEHRLVELTQLSVVATDDGNVIDFRKHGVLPVRSRRGDRSVAHDKPNASTKTIRAGDGRAISPKSSSRRQR